MKYYGGWSLFELYSLPVGLRNWYFELLTEHKKEENEQMKNANKKSYKPPRF